MSNYLTFSVQHAIIAVNFANLAHMSTATTKSKQLIRTISIRQVVETNGGGKSAMDTVCSTATAERPNGEATPEHTLCLISEKHEN